MPSPEKETIFLKNKKKKMKHLTEDDINEVCKYDATVKKVVLLVSNFFSFLICAVRLRCVKGDKIHES